MLLKVNLKKVPILQALLRSAAEYFAYLVSLGCRNQALSGAHFFKISLCSIFAKNIANLVSLEICKQISARSLSLACALIGHYLGSLLQARHVFFLSAFTARWSKKYILPLCQAPVASSLYSDGGTERGIVHWGTRSHNFWQIS